MGAKSLSYWYGWLVTMGYGLYSSFFLLVHHDSCVSPVLNIQRIICCTILLLLDFGKLSWRLLACSSLFVTIVWTFQLSFGGASFCGTKEGSMVGQPYSCTFVAAWVKKMVIFSKMLPPPLLLFGIGSYLLLSLGVNHIFFFHCSLAYLIFNWRASLECTNWCQSSFSYKSFLHEIVSYYKSSDHFICQTVNYSVP